MEFFDKHTGAAGLSAQHESGRNYGRSGGHLSRLVAGTHRGRRPHHLRPDPIQVYEISGDGAVHG